MKAVLIAAMVSAALVSRVDAQNLVERGKYLVEVIGACGNCHTPKGPNGDLAEKHLAGGFVIEEAFGKAVGRNITQDKETGIGSWTDREIIRAIREGKAKDGGILGPPMPFPLYKDLSDNDVKAMVAYLRTVKPVNAFRGIPHSLRSAPAQIQYAAEIKASAKADSADSVSSTVHSRRRSRTPI